MLPSHPSFTPWQALWYIGGVLFFPIALTGEPLLALGTRAGTACLLALVAMPLLCFPLNLLMRLVLAPSYQPKLVVPEAVVRPHIR